MSFRLDIQNVAKHKDVPSKANFIKWLTNVLQRHIDDEDTQVTLRIVDEEEGRKLNKEFRRKDYATNVLSFPFDDEDELAEHYLGDIIICVPVLEKEAKEKNISIESHYAHLFIHGVLHLLGFDHEEDEQANEMENEEIEILAEFGFENPYE